MASSAGAIIIARNTKAKTRSWTIGESPLGGFDRLESNHAAGDQMGISHFGNERYTFWGMVIV
jgi:hypothetical protein